jgi:broad specificity phosphatase PhoE
VTTTFFLVRHAAHDRVASVLCGRMPGVSLGPRGHEQARRVAARLSTENVASVQSSALERARQTAEPIAGCVARTVELNDGIMEVDFGAWSGRSFEDLERDPRWASWNKARAVSRPPGGETMLEAQARIVGAIERLESVYRDRAVVLVSHADVIKAALLYHLGLPIDAFARFDIDAASISTLVVGSWGSKVVRLNEVVAA